MRIFRDLHHIPADGRGTVIALGNFDGMHLGHQAIFQHCTALARAENCPAAAMTFEPHPRQFFAPDHAPMHIYPFRCKAQLIESQGAGILMAARFNARLAATSAESFIEDILHGALKVRHVVTGYNFAFGKGRQGNTALLSRLAQTLGFGFTAHQPVRDEQGGTISSSAIRGLLKTGDMKSVAAMLGRPYRIGGRVRRGDGRGRKLGFPTANLSLAGLLPPRLGIYAARLTIGAEAKTYDAVASLGVRPMFPAAKPLLEVHVFDMDRDLYGQYVRVEPVEFIREERKFADEKALAAEIANDCARAKRILKSFSLLAGNN